ncbi:hypothetical protein [Roseovarius sp.]|uniref:hypothetical protein n=1 Tax=Roseovarius sp. TaxID=1486281 RepID=UPI0026098232|nr:hypothetical protein [Roseovarius sp.]MDW3118004.1 hypothetical protein [Roseovarius pacificus]
MRHESNINSLLRNTEIACEFERWLREGGDTLVDAAELLGGSAWSRRAIAVVDCARNAGDLHARRRDLALLARLLRLEFADEPWRPEAIRFAALHPDDPRAEAAMYCADAVSRGSRALEALRLAGLPAHGEERQ